jgi:hypothetical protein
MMMNLGGQEYKVPMADSSKAFPYEYFRKLYGPRPAVDAQVEYSRLFNGK